MLRWFRQAGVDAEIHPAIRPMEAPHTARDIAALRRLVRESGADVVNLHYGLSYISLKDVLAVRLAGRRCVASVHHTTPWCELDSEKRTMTRLAARLCHRVVAGTPAMQNLLEEAGVARAKIALVPYGAPAPTRRPSRAEARDRLGLPHDAFVVSTLTRLVPYKSLNDLIAALARLPDPQCLIRLVVAGEGPERAALEAQAFDHLGDRARFLGRVQETEEVYAVADVFALPSREEGFGLVYIEAAFHGVPGIGCAVGGVPYAIRDGVTGLLIPAGDCAALAVAIQRLRADEPLRRTMGEAARNRAYEEFTEAHMAERYDRVLFGRRGAEKATARPDRSGE
jgi:glycosyltransferase involved in cell wall biosynthesis